VGFDSNDDAAVYKINEDTAMIQTVDFFPPMVDDPYSFGQIAAANALSDVYAMGGKPVLAMNLLTFPNCLPLSVVEGILQGGASKVLEAGAVIAGGHSIEDKEPKYGLCVTGLVNPRKVLTNNGIKEGDILIITKALGTGIITTAAKAELLTPEENKTAITLMATLNKAAAEAAQDFNIHGCTDITGFGLIGHVAEMTDGNHTIELWGNKIPVLPKAMELARMGIIPAGAYRNMDYTKNKVQTLGTLPQERLDVLYDPQTSGGLLLSVPEEEGEQLVQRLKDSGLTGAAIGCVVPKGEKEVIIK
jgi:selenide,water dikinase